MNAQRRSTNLPNSLFSCARSTNNRQPVCTMNCCFNILHKLRNTTKYEQTSWNKLLCEWVADKTSWTCINKIREINNYQPSIHPFDALNALECWQGSYVKGPLCLLGLSGQMVCLDPTVRAKSVSSIVEVCIVK